MRDPLRDAFDRYKAGAPVLPDARFLVRWGLGFVFLWFGIDKFVHPAYWPMWIPGSLPALRTPMAIAGFGAFEIAIGLALVSNFRVREASALASLFLAGIIVTTGLAAVVRDVGLLAAALYLTLATPGPTPQRALSRERSRWKLAIPKRALIGAGIGTLLVGGVLAAGVDRTTQEQPADATGPLLSFESPQAGFEGPAGDVPVSVRVAIGREGPLANHVHFKVDGQVMDAVYLRGASTASTLLKGLGPGIHEIEAYLAYSDHVEHPGSRAKVAITLR